MSLYEKQINQIFIRHTHVEHVLREKKILTTYAMYNYSIRVIKTYSHTNKSNQNKNILRNIFPIRK